MSPLAPARARTGCRVDLAGGTLDIWPLGLLHEGATTVNVAVDVPVEAAISPRERGYAIEVGERTARANDLEKLFTDADARFPALLAASLALPPASIRLESASPRGAGLGASSALGVALVAAADHALGRPARPTAACAAFVRDVEARLMGLPTGTQDHFPPLLGGVLALGWEPGGTRIDPLDVDLDALAARLAVAYSGKSHVSGDTNWGVVRRRLEADPAICRSFDGIVAAARALPAALESGDWQEAGRLVAEEWRWRRQLAPGVSTPEIERMLESADRAGAWGGKACGAGGGGCVAVLAPAKRRPEVEAALAAAGGILIDARPTARGVRIVP